MSLPKIFEHYEVSITETDTDITVTTKGSLSRIDLVHLESLGWTKYDDVTVVFEKPVFVEVDNVDKKRGRNFKAK